MNLMLIRRLNECEAFIARDNTILREILHPAKQDVTARYSIVHATVHPGDTSLLHSLNMSEVYSILRGKGMMMINDESATVGPDDTIYIPPHAKQQIHNDGDEDLVFLAIVDPAWKEEDEIIYRNGKGSE